MSLSAKTIVDRLLETEEEGTDAAKDDLASFVDPKRVEAYYEIVTDESAAQGDAAERGELDDLWTESDWWDIEDETLEESVARALRDAGVAETSSSPFSPGDWYVVNDPVRSDGTCETRTYHLYGFTPEQELAIHELVFPNTYRR